MTTHLEDFTTEQIDFVINAIEQRLKTVVSGTETSIIVAGECEEWEALTLFKVQLLNAKRSVQLKFKTWSN